MKKLAMLAILAFVSVPAFAGSNGQGQSQQGQGQGQGQYEHEQYTHHRHHHDCDHGRGYGSSWGNQDRAIGPARGYYHLNSRGASCDGARAFVGSRGAVIMYYGDGLYERVVRDGSFCPRDQYTQPFWAGDCFVGYTCAENNGD